MKNLNYDVYIIRDKEGRYLLEKRPKTGSTCKYVAIPYD